MMVSVWWRVMYAVCGCTPAAKACQTQTLFLMNLSVAVVPSFIELVASATFCCTLPMSALDPSAYVLLLYVVWTCILVKMSLTYSSDLASIVIAVGCCLRCL